MRTISKYNMKKFFYFFISAFVALSLFFNTNLLAQCDQPMAVGDFASTLQGTSIVIHVQKNDSTTIYGQPVLRPLVTEIVTNPSASVGTVTVLNNDSILFTPNGSFLGIATFTYRVCNTCGCSDPANVTVVISNYCGAPVLQDDIFVIYNNANNRLDVLANDSFPAQIPYTISVTSQPAFGAVSVSGNQLNYFNAGNDVGVSTFTYTVCYDRESGDTCPACETATVTLNSLGNCVNPIANDDNLSTVQGQRDTVDVLVNDNLQGFNLNDFYIVQQPKHGNATIVNDKMTYRASNSYTGLDTVVYAICTPCGCDTAVFLVGVASAVCQQPIAVIDVHPTGYSDACSFSYDVLKNDINPLNCGNLKLTGILIQPEEGLAVADTLTGMITYTGPGFALDTFVSIIYEVCNDAGCDTATLALYVGPYSCNAYAPTLFNDREEVCNRDTIYLNVLENDYDRDYGQSVKLKNIAGQGAHGDAYVISDSVVMFVPYDPHYVGHDFFFYTACDDGTPTICDIARVDLNIFSCDNPPVVIEDGNPIDTIRITFPEDSSVVLCMNVTDPDGDKTHIISIEDDFLTVTTADTVLTHDTTFCINISSPENWNGIDTFLVIACDETSLCDSIVVIVTVTPVNDGIIAVDDKVVYTHSIGFEINQTTNDIDEDGAGFSTTVVIDDNSENGTFGLNSSGNINYVPNGGFAGIDTFYYVICQPEGTETRVCDTAAVVVIVPVKAVNDNATTESDKSVDINVKENDYTTSTSKVSLCSEANHGTLELVSSEDGIIRYMPNGYEGTDSFCYTLCGVINGEDYCSNAVVVVVVEPLPPLDIPEGFSPNGDGTNDKFVIKNIERYPKSDLIVFNRWGDIVWRNPGTGYHNDFDGTWDKKNQPLPDGTYYYVLKLNDNKAKDITGFLVINR